MDSHFESTIIFALICTMLIGLLLLIYHTDNPFEVGPDSFADDDLEIPLEAQGLSIFGRNHVDGEGGSIRLIARESSVSASVGRP